MAEEISIEFLEDYRHLFSTIEKWYKKEWMEYYGPGGQGDALSDLNSFCNKYKLPICLVALKHGAFIGTVALRKKSASHHHLSPWVTSLFVIPKARRKGIGTKLIEAVEILSANLRIPEIYSRSATAAEFFRKKHWAPIDRIENQGLTIFSRKLKPHSFISADCRRL